MKTSAVVKLKFSSPKITETVLTALKPEATKPATARSKITVEKNGLLLTIKVEATDTTALRATLNSYLRWTSALADVLENLKPAETQLHAGNPA
ncbi:MAG: KEOPS complex subunit Pcc1 [Candidatus Bathyarchaeota archaeon]|nr:KEOPS complex subunit Pcc1 [Candidatus Bathyarchaeota archaeon]